MRPLIFLTLSILANAAGFETFCFTVSGALSLQIQEELLKQEVQRLLPAREIPPSARNAVAYAEGLLRGMDYKEGEMPPMEILDSLSQRDLFRVGEILDVVDRRGEFKLLPHQQAWVRVFHATKDRQLITPIGPRTEMFNPAEKENILKLLNALGDSDPVTLARARFLVENGANLDQIVDGLSDRIAIQLTPQQIASMPFVFSRWPAHKVSGHHAIRGQDTYIFQDPTKRFSILYLPPRQGSAGKEHPALLEAVQLVDSRDGEYTMKTFEKKGDAETSRSEACMNCHLVSRGRFFSLTRVRPGVEFAVGGQHRIAGPAGSSFFLSSVGFRQGGIATPILRPSLPPELLQ